MGFLLSWATILPKGGEKDRPLNIEHPVGLQPVSSDFCYEASWIYQALGGKAIAVGRVEGESFFLFFLNPQKSQQNQSLKERCFWQSVEAQGFLEFGYLAGSLTSAAAARHPHTQGKYSSECQASLWKQNFPNHLQLVIQAWALGFLRRKSEQTVILIGGVGQ